MTPEDLVTFIRGHKWGVVATVGDTGAPEAAVVGIAVTDELELIFDTVASTRKAVNLRRDNRAALVVGWDEGQTVQVQGVCDEPAGAEGERIRVCYLAAFPDGTARLAWPGITHFRVRPSWVRYSDFRGSEPAITEYSGGALRPSPPEST